MMSHASILQPMTPEIARKLAARLAGADEAVAVGSRSGVIEWTNSAWERITGWALEDDVNKPVTRLLAEIAPEPSVIEYIEASYLAGRRAVVELPIETPGGEALFIHLEVDPYRDATGEITDFVCIATDITDRRLAELALDRHASVQTDLGDDPRSADASALARSVAALAENPSDAEAFVVDAIDAISALDRELARIEGSQPAASNAHARLRRIIDRVNRSMRSGAPTASATDLSALVLESARSLRGEIPAKASIDLDFEEAGRLAIVDAARLSEVVLDLMRSALASIGDEWGTLSVTTRTTRPGEPLRSPTYHRTFGGTLRDVEPRAFVELHDTAVPLTPDELARIGEPVLPVSGSPRVGVLLRARTLISAMGGELHVGSVPGCGTQILILLPSTSIGLA